MTAEERQGYQGWTNYETFSVKFWLDTEEPRYRYWHERPKHWHAEASTSQYWTRDESAKCNLGDELKNTLEEMMEQAWDESPRIPDFVQDLAQSAFSDVNWYEIAEVMLESVRNRRRPPRASGR